MDKTKLPASLEALLFAYGEPLTLKKLSELTASKAEQVQEALTALAAELEQNPQSGLVLVENDASFQLAVKAVHFPLVEKLVKQDFHEELSPASLEVLTIVLYRGPLARAEIDYIRGVNSSFILRSLMLRGLIERLPDTKGHHLFLYAPSFNLLRFLGISSVNELPDFAALSKKYEEILAASAAEREADSETRGVLAAERKKDNNTPQADG